MKIRSFAFQMGNKRLTKETKFDTKRNIFTYKKKSDTYNRKKT